MTDKPNDSNNHDNFSCDVDSSNIVRLPCPFCGSKDIRFTRHDKAGVGPYHLGKDVWSTCCYDCGATFPNRYSKKALVDCWNRRPSPQNINHKQT